MLANRENNLCNSLFERNILKSDVTFLPTDLKIVEKQTNKQKPLEYSN